MPRQPISHVRKVKFAQGVFAGQTQKSAARAAGFSGKGLEAQASRLARDPAVVAELERLRSEHEAKAVATRDEVLRVLTGHLRGDLSQFVKVVVAPVPATATTLDPEKAGGPTPRTTRVATIDLEMALKSGALACLESLAITDDGIRIKLHSVQGAAERLARLQGWDKPVKVELTRSVESMTEAELLVELAKLGVLNAGQADAERRAPDAASGGGAGHASVPAPVRQPDGGAVSPDRVPGVEKKHR